MKKTRKKAAKPPKTAAPAGKKIQRPDISRVEFLRNAYGLIPEPDDPTPGAAYQINGASPVTTFRFCSCPAGRRRAKDCRHLRQLSLIRPVIDNHPELKDFETAFRASVWFRLAEIMAERTRESPESVSFLFGAPEDEKALIILNDRDETIAAYFSRGPDAVRFMERCANYSPDQMHPHRGEVLNTLATLAQTPSELVMMRQGLRSRRQAMESSFWHRMAYHGFREAGPSPLFHISIHPDNRALQVMCKGPPEGGRFSWTVPGEKAERILNALSAANPPAEGLRIHDEPAELLFKGGLTADRALEMRPAVRLKQENGDDLWFAPEDLTPHVYGNLVFLEEAGVLAPLKPLPGRRHLDQAARTRRIPEAEVPEFLAAHYADIDEGRFLMDESVKTLRIYRSPGKMEVLSDALARDWCWLSVRYGVGHSAVSLVELLQAKAENKRFIRVEDGWLDAESPELDGLAPLTELLARKNAVKKDKLRFSWLDLFRLMAASGVPGSLRGRAVKKLKRIIDLKPASPPPLAGMKTPLRGYQENGVEWLWFLFENRLGGLLCDDMGLGKTHQTMALMLLLKQTGRADPMLTVCPVTVMSHWEEKIRLHAPSLKAGIYHGPDRDPKKTLSDCDVMITSYAILRNDIETLKQTRFSLAVFDEIQHLKNPATQSHGAAREVAADMMLGLTGTPIENSIQDIKALMDLVLPGYLGADAMFQARYGEAVLQDRESRRKQELVRLLSPFTLRRLKKTVLDELPEKIEDIRTCRLHEDQVKLYREALALKGGGLLTALRNHDDPVPYIHIFALLSLLKQICDHPAVAEGSPDNYAQYGSGKWDLFTELLAESLDSGQKVVVYSQYLDMIRIMEAHLASMGIGCAALTGASRNRGAIVRRFNTDPDCRVFVGSLMAGGTGIDLVAASVVIHYDRWWNAAREDQATDRVHRIGQQRGVQVFKLVTLGTLEEKISAIIETKRNLLDGVIREDDPDLLKSFTRDQLIDILTTPVSES